MGKGFAITADFTYARSDAFLVKDFSVDVRGSFFTRSSRKRPMCELDVLIECKQRARSKWLCFPDPNIEDFLPATWGHTIRVMDQFSRWFILSKSSTLDGDDLPICYKALEVDDSSDKAYESELRHGLFQLQYALPRLVSDHIRSSTEDPEDEWAPFIFTAILATNAELVVAHRNITIPRIERAASVRELGRTVPFLVFYLDVGSELERHCARECAHLQPLVEKLAKTERYRTQNGAYESDLPSSAIRALMTGGRGGAALFSHFLVCNIGALPTLIGEVKNIANRHAGRMVPKLPTPRRRKQRTP